jgi:hypothetical protein
MTIQQIFRFLNHGVLPDNCYVTVFTEFTNGFSSIYILDEHTARHISATSISNPHNDSNNGFGGLGVACWPLVPKFAGSNPAEAVGFLGRKKSSAHLPSEGK